METAGKAARKIVERAQVSVEIVNVTFELDMHYLGQTHTVAVPLPIPAGDISGVNETTVRAAFERAYSAAFSRLLPGIPVRIVSLRTAAIGRRPAFDLAAFAPDAGASLAKAERGTRQVWFDGAWHETRVWSRLDLPVDAIIDAPAVIEQPDATIFIEPGLRGRVDALGNIVVERI
jgi:N-methylhydantoinase A